MATPPQGPKNDVGETLSGPSRPLLRLAKVTQKRGFSRRFPGNLPTVFSAGFPAVFRRFDAGFPAVLPTVLPAVSRQFASGFPAVSRRFPGGFPAVFRRFSSGFQRFPSGFPAVFQQFSSGFAGGSTAVSWWFPGGLAGGFTDGSTATRCPWINPGPAPEYPFIRKKLSGNSVHTFKPTNPAYGKRKVSAGTWSPGKKRCRQEPNAPGGSSGGPDSRPGCLGGHIPRNVSNRPFWTERCGLCVA